MVSTPGCLCLGTDASGSYFKSAIEGCCSFSVAFESTRFVTLPSCNMHISMPSRKGAKVCFRQPLSRRSGMQTIVGFIVVVGSCFWLVVQAIYYLLY